MNADIMAISNQLVYGHRLKCGTAAVAERKLVLLMQSRLDECLAAREVSKHALAFKTCYGAPATLSPFCLSP